MRENIQNIQIYSRALEICSFDRAISNILVFVSSKLVKGINFEDQIFN